MMHAGPFDDAPTTVASRDPLQAQVLLTLHCSSAPRMLLPYDLAHCMLAFVDCSRARVLTDRAGVSENDCVGVIVCIRLDRRPRQWS